ncbi:MAG: hypothetical protein VX398_07485 [Acidobacteriota bacterium]|nr:hypothetical protein [Acidobacteriota bacterium]
MSRQNEVFSQLLSQPPLPWLITAAKEHAEPVLLVGGVIRDALRGDPHADLDIAVAGDLEAFIDTFGRYCGRCPVAIGDPWRDTRRMRLGNTSVDIGKIMGTVSEDLGQRDFTINAMALRLDLSGPAELIDLHGGRTDLAAGVIRMISEEALREDPLRALRAIRYVSTLDGFKVEKSTETTISRYVKAIDEVSNERVQAEWGRLLGGPHWVSALRLAFDLGVGERTFGGVADLGTVSVWSDFEATVSDLMPQDCAQLRLAALLCGLGATNSSMGEWLIERRWPVALARRATLISSWAMAMPGADGTQMVGWAIENHEIASLAACLVRALSAEDEQNAVAALQLETYAARAAETPWIRGMHLVSWGMAEGPMLGALLEQAARGQVERRWESCEEAHSWARAQVTDNLSEMGH